MGHSPRSGSPIPLMLSIICAFGMGWGYRQAHLPETKAEVAPIAAVDLPPRRPAPPAPGAPPPPVEAPARVTPPRAPTPLPTPEPLEQVDGGPRGLPVYTGMMKMGGKPMAIFAGRTDTVQVGEEINDATVVAITPQVVTLRQGGVLYKVPVDTNPARHVGGPPPPKAIRVPDYAARRAAPAAGAPAPPWSVPPGPPPGAPRGYVDPTPGTVITHQTIMGTPVFVPVTPKPFPVIPYAGSGTSRR